MVRKKKKSTQKGLGVRGGQSRREGAEGKQRETGQRPSRCRRDKRDDWRKVQNESRDQDGNKKNRKAGL